MSNRYSDYLNTVGTETSNLHLMSDTVNDRGYEKILSALGKNEIETR